MRRATALLSALAALAAGACQSTAPREAASPASRAVAAPAAPQDEAPGLVRIPNYAEPGAFLSGDWGGDRTALAQDGLSFDGQLTQFAQGLVSGGLQDRWHFPLAIDVIARWDLQRAADWPAVITARFESRFGSSVNETTGLILPANTEIAYPATDPADKNIPLAITEANIRQLVSEEFAVTLGKIQAFRGDPSEFAGGQGREQFQNFALIASPVAALAIPYSSFAAGAEWTPGERVALSTWLMDTAAGRRFSAVGEGLTWVTEADFQHRLGELPGGINLGTIYAFDGDFRELNGQLQLPPGDADLPEESTTWAAYWTGWQYLHAEGPVPEVVDGTDAEPDLRGFGVFARFGVADKTTNPVAWTASLGFGGRGVLSRELDSWGLGAFHNALQVPDTTELPNLGENAMGVEAFYAFALSRAARLTFDVQWLDSAFDTVEDSVVMGLRLNLIF